MTTIDIYRDTPAVNTFFWQIKPDASSVQLTRIMGDNVLNITFEDSRYLEFKINDFCTVYGERYQLNKLPPLTKLSRFLYKYTLQFQAVAYDLAKAQYLFFGSDNTLRESDFSLMGNANDFVDLVVANANRVGSGWTKGDVIATGYKNLTFTREHCYNALSRLAEEFETEFWIIGKTINLVKMTNDTGNTYRHGRQKGLYELTRNNLNNADLVTRLYAYGSEKNLPESYVLEFGRRLRFPGGTNPCLISDLTCTLVNNGNGTQTFTFFWNRPLSGASLIHIEYRLAGTTNAWSTQTGFWVTPRTLTVPVGNYEFRFVTMGGSCTGSRTPALTITANITTPVFTYDPLPYLERNIDQYGIIEHTQIFDDIFPHRTGVVTAVNGGDPFVFTDTAIDFDVNSYLLPGITAKVVFNTGQLAGYEFELASFNNGTKQFKMNKIATEKVLDLPSTLLRPAIGDEYVLVDIYLPQSYIDAAEEELLNKASALLNQLSEPQLTYTLVLDEAFMKRLNRVIRIGDLVWIQDDELNVERKIRVVGISRNIVNEYNFVVEISDTIEPGTVQRLINAQTTTDRDVSGINREIENNSILNNKVVGTLVFENIPTTNTYTGFSEVLIEDATGKLHRKV